MEIPSKEHCFHLMCEMAMMDHIAAHCMRVCHVALFLVDNLRPHTNLNRDLVQAAALLHDITKTRSFDTQENHAETAEHLLGDLGYPELGRIVGQHVQLDAYDAADVLSDVEIVNYADKRVLHDRVVSLDKRFDYIMGKYAVVSEDRKRIRLFAEKTAEVEKRVFDRLPLSPDALGGHLDPAIYAQDLKDYHAGCDSDTRQ
ncbi:MAG: HD domain-containing protein [Desulfobacterales bacterium]